MNSQSLYEQLVQQIREEHLEEIQSSLFGGIARMRKGKKPGPKAKAKANGKTKVTAKRTKPATPTKLARRDPESMTKLIQSLKSYIGRHAGASMEEIGSGMGLSTKELKLPMQKLLEDKAVTRKGERRAARYTAKA